MNKIIIITCISLVISLINYGQSRESQSNQKNEDIKTFMGNDRSFGGYGAFSFGYTTINNKFVFTASGQGAFVIGHDFALGFRGVGFTKHYDYWAQNETGLAGGYGGLFMEPILFPKFPIHVAFPITIGFGFVSVTSYDNYFIDDFSKGADGFIVFEPGLEVEFNIIKMFRIALDFRYRFTSNVNLLDSADNHLFDKNVLFGFTTGITFKLGKF